MNNTVKLAIGTFAALIILGVIALIGFNSQNSSNNGSSQGGINQQSNLSATSDPDVAATITYTGTDFQPNRVTINQGDTVRIRNRSMRNLIFASDQYGAGASYEPELNIGLLKPGETHDIYVSQKGIWGYHNTNDQSETGTIIVH